METLSGGKIELCSAEKGGVVYMTGGNVGVAGGSIISNTVETMLTFNKLLRVESNTGVWIKGLLRKRVVKCKC